MTENDPALPRLRHIPEEFRAKHLFCYWIHDRILDVLKQAEARRITDVHFTFASEDEKREFEATNDIYEFLNRTGREDVAKRLVLNQTVLPLFGDMLHFIYEALSALERRKYTVAFALLRKPLKYNLLFATWLWVDEDDFFTRMESSPAEEMDDRKMSAERRAHLLKSAVASFGEGTGLDGEMLYQIVFERGNNRGLAPYFDMAIHLVTSDKKIRTDRLNLNFIFKNPLDIDIYENGYFPIAYVLMYLYLLQLHIFGRMTVISEAYVNWAKAAMLGTFELLFLNGATNILTELNDELKKLMTCVACGSHITVTSAGAPDFFLSELLICNGCGTEQQFPLFWLMTRPKMDA